MIDISKLELWFVPGSQSLYGEATLTKVADHSREIVSALSTSPAMPVKIVCQPVMTTPESIQELCLDANRARYCVGLITWMHTFSPAQIWIPGLRALHKPFVHLHTQFNRELPWSTIDMDFMNLNQSAHGDREFGFITSRLRINHKVVAGFWQDEEVQSELATWVRAACAWHDAQTLKVARFGDNMRQVAVTEGDKVEAKIKLGYSVDGYGVGDLVDSVQEVTDREVDSLVAEYEIAYILSEPLQVKARRAEHFELQRGSKSGCDTSSTAVVLGHSPTISRTSMAWPSCLELPCRGLWQMDMASARKETGRLLRLCGR